jgi:hypothetical protein
VGLPLSAKEPSRASAAHALLSSDDRVLRSIPGYRLLWRSPPDIRQPNGAPSDFFRIFELSPDATPGAAIAVYPR